MDGDVRVDDAAEELVYLVHHDRLTAALLDELWPRVELDHHPMLASDLINCDEKWLPHLLRLTPDLFELEDDLGQTMLAHAVKDNQSRQVPILLQAGADPNVNFGVAMATAAEAEQWAILQLMLKAGADPRYLSTDALLALVSEQNWWGTWRLGPTIWPTLTRLDRIGLPLSLALPGQLLGAALPSNLARYVQMAL